MVKKIFLIFLCSGLFFASAMALLDDAEGTNFRPKQFIFFFLTHGTAMALMFYFVIKKIDGKKS